MQYSPLSGILNSQEKQNKIIEKGTRVQDTSNPN